MHCVTIDEIILSYPYTCIYIYIYIRIYRNRRSESLKKQTTISRNRHEANSIIKYLWRTRQNISSRLHMDLDLGAARTGVVGASRRSAQRCDVTTSGTCQFPCPRSPLPSNAALLGDEGGRGAEGNNEEKGGLEVRRKVVKVTVALTARARNNIGVQLSVMCDLRMCAQMCGRMCVYVCMHVRWIVCNARAKNAREDLFLVPRATAFLTEVLSVKCESARGIPMADLDRRLWCSDGRHTVW